MVCAQQISQLLIRSNWKDLIIGYQTPTKTVETEDDTNRNIYYCRLLLSALPRHTVLPVILVARLTLNFNYLLIITSPQVVYEQLIFLSCLPLVLLALGIGPGAFYMPNKDLLNK